MTKLLKSNAVIIVLALVALFFVYSNIVKPLVGTQEQAMEAAIVDVPPDLPPESNEPTAGGSEQALQMATAQYDIGHFETSDLHWNEHPERDPFAPRSAIKEQDVTAVQDKVQVSVRGVKVSQLAVPVVSAVVRSQSYRYAVINDQIVGIGDRVGAYRVDRLDRASVTLRRLSSNQIIKVLVKE